MSNLLQNQRDLFIESALPLIATYNISKELLAQTSKQMGKPVRYEETLFSHEPVKGFALSMVSWWDRQMLGKLDQPALQQLRLNERIYQCVKTRLQSIQHHKAAFRSLHYYYCQPCHARDAMSIAWQTSDLIWSICGDKSTDFNYYSKRSILLSVYGATFLYWLHDDSTDCVSSWEFLQRRIDNVLLIGRFKQKLKSLLPAQSA